MINKIITIYFLTLELFSFGQSVKVKELMDLYQTGKYEQTINKAIEYIKEEPHNLDYNLLLGRAYSDNLEYEKAIPNLEFTVENDKENSWRKGWALDYLGRCYFMLSNYKKSQEELESCIKLNATKNSSISAQQEKALFGFDKVYNDWKTVESENFRFHFQEMPDAETQIFIQKKESAFKKINDFFNCKLPKKIDYYVWNSRSKAHRVLQRNIGFAKPSYCIVHTYYKQTIGHEMTHVISSYAANISKKTELINEGISVYFDQSNQDKENIAKIWLSKNKKTVDIKVMWTNWKSYPDELSYPLSGLFVKVLIDSFGKEKFLEFFINQTYENAKNIFGDKLDLIIGDFENKFND
jgi:tetratricopeptide (TPR) repeat protein